MKKRLIITLAIVIIGLTAGHIILGGLEKSEKTDCLRWQSEAKEFQSYFIKDWQKTECDQYGITIDAPVQ